MNVNFFSHGRFALGLTLVLFAAHAHAGQHQGVASCAGSICHGATQASGGRGIRQDEYFLWQSQDRHAQAYNTLRSERSRGMAARLGWGEATEAPGCLSCHVGVIPAAQRGERFQLSDGVGCEACHGGAESWLESHTKGYASLAARSEAGLYPLWDKGARAQVCLSCHQGDDERRMSHSIMAAGHPPLLFELDTFTQLQPAHFDPDADYTERKGAPDAAALWLAGQLQAADQWLQALTVSTPGVFPELALYDCNACHRSMQQTRAQAARVGGQAPGSVPLGDTSLLLLNHWLNAASPPALAERWRAGWRALHEAVARGDSNRLRERARAQQALLRAELRPLAAQPLGSAPLRRQLDLLCGTSLSYLDGDFSHAEQAVMAVAVLMTALGERGQLSPNAAARAALDRLYASVKQRDQYTPQTYRAALNELRAALR